MDKHMIGDTLFHKVKNSFPYFSTKTYVVGTQLDGSFEQPKCIV